MSFEKLQIKRIALIIFIVIVLSVPLNLILAFNIINWGWSDNIGWISLHRSEAPAHSVVLGTDGILSGFAWSDHIGWLTFDEARLSGCPVAPCRAWVDLATNRTHGWARAWTIAENHATAGGWTGWIRLRGPHPANGGSAGEHGLVLSGIHLHGWAWSDDVGWINFMELPVRQGQIILRLRGNEQRIFINPQGLIEIVR